MDELLRMLLIFFAGVVASFVNVMAGGGSALTLATMMLLGVDAPVANGTNRIGLLVESTSGASTYAYELDKSIRESIILGLLTIPGAVIGAFLAVNISDDAFQNILSGVIIFVIISLFVPTDKIKKSSKEPSRYLLWLGMFIVGLYGGFVQAGIGFLIIFVLKYLKGISFVEINMHKVFIVLIYNIPILFLFGFTGNINYIYAISLALGSAIGAFISVKVSVRKGDRVVKFVIGLVLIAMAIRFLLS
ncbi:sulfite exporter TauE/SafE family protein [Natranaerofaba carboxydovora]|uniref:sulfite exporter TauE/SafE family protein n=1 Tax=Natranaerofaba carboxydovora TaxID=2742683 RepID=UPI001F1304C0|nr:sulfite exporter TauE/SafE family protein [Natranaerofaba carboxydovora]UMZ74335.1 Sulfite exporter TauE/SafE [Natranaerofaba carboxydovora]